MQKTNINPEILQQMLESASNAAEKGQSQFFTPVEFGRRLALALPQHRPAIVDLNCGAAHLLYAAANQTTRHLFGADIDPCRNATRDKNHPAHEMPHLSVDRITYDLTRLYPLLAEVNVRADLFVLNPPWRLHWYRDRLQDLADSDLPAVRDAFAAIEPGLPGGKTIDSTIATLLIALDRCTIYGEGMLIANNATLERLIFAERAPHGAVARHIWGRVIVPGNPMTGLDGCQWKEDEEFHTGIIYFARDHTAGPREFTLEQLAGCRVWRGGAELGSGYYADKTLPDLWRAVHDRVAELEGKRSRVPWNMWLTVNGRIRTQLSLFQKQSRKIDKWEADRLFALNDRAPMELVLQRNQRDELLHVMKHSAWRVEPALIAAVEKAVADYHAARAPLYPLSKIQRLGYLDEQDKIECVADLMGSDGRVVFQKGRSYPIRTQTVTVQRKKKKPNNYTGEMEELELTGQELAIFIAERERAGEKDKVKEYAFMDASLRESNTVVHLVKGCGSPARSSHWDPDEARTVPAQQKKPENTIDFTLQELCDHFSIPEVPDVATVNPQGYAENIAKLEELEKLLSAA